MKVQELRKLIAASDREHLEKAFVESYKQLRKDQKEELDPMLVGILEGKAVEKKKTESLTNFEELEKQIVEFMENAYAQNYLVPNRIVPKSQRPKWRFMVKNFIKELEKVLPESEYYPRSVELLTDLYLLICEACNYYLFSTEDAFRSIGWDQPELFQLLVKKTFANGYSRETISNLLVYAATGGLSRESLHIQQEFVLLNCLKTSDVKRIAMEEAKRLMERDQQKLNKLGKCNNQRYLLDDAVNELCGTILMLSIELGEPETGVSYYFEHSRERDEEITLYCALERVAWMEEDDLWLKVYEYGIEKKIQPRDRLRKEYEERLKAEEQ